MFGDLVVRIGADISGLRRDVETATKSLKGLDAAVQSVGSVLKVLAVGAAANELAQMVGRSLEAVDATSKLARQLGGTVKGLQGLRLAASDAGINAQTLNAAIDNLNEKLGEAAQKGKGPAAEALDKLGLSARELARLDVDERMASIADAIQAAGMSAQEAQFIIGELGLKQGELSRLMADGGDEIRAATAEIEEMGVALSSVDAAHVEEARAAMHRVGIATEGVVDRLAVSLSPLINVVSDQIVELAKDTGGFKDETDAMASIAEAAYGVVADAVHVVELGLGHVSVAAYAMDAALAEAAASAAKAMQGMVNSWVDDLNKGIEAFNALAPEALDLPTLPDLITDEDVSVLEEHAARTAASLRDVEGRMRALSESEWPSDKIARMLEEARAAAKAVAEETDRARLNLPGGSPNTDADKEEEEKRREKLQKQLDTLREFAMTEEEELGAKHERRLEQLNEALEAELLTLGEYHDITEGLEREHQEALAKLREDGSERMQRIHDALLDSLGTVSQGLMQSLNALAQNAHANYEALARSGSESDRRRASDAERHARHMFDVSKGFAIADALIQGSLGVAKTLGAYPFPENLIFAAPHAAAAAAQVAMIAAQQFQSAGGTVTAPAAAAAGGGSRAVSSSPVGSAQGGGITGGSTQGVNINLIGEVFNRQQVLSLIENINEAVADGARIVVN